MNESTPPPSQAAAQAILTDPKSYRAAEQNCDLVMKGGITSGAVYPWAICELARKFRLRNIAGTSAGAIAAGAAAAAEYGRGSKEGGYPALAALPQWMSARPPGSRHSNLFHLFQAARPLRPVFRALKTLGETGAVSWRLLRAVCHLLTGPLILCLVLAAMAPGVALIALVTQDSLAAREIGGWTPLWAALAGWIAAVATAALVVRRALAREADEEVLRSSVFLRGLLAAVVVLVAVPPLAQLLFRPDGALWWSSAYEIEIGLFLALAGAGIGAILGVFVVLRREAPSNLFGMCTGMPGAGGGPEALTPWLHARLQELAGRAPDAAPLTFGDLEKGPPRRKGHRKIALRILTTCVTQGRPYLLPELPRTFFFDPAEFRRLFPEQVVAHLEDHGKAILAAARKNGDDDFLVACRAMHPRLPLADGKELPVLLAVRMSLSFPLLISAVPLWDFDWNRRTNARARTAWRTWISKHPEQWDQLRGGNDKPADPPAGELLPERLWFSDGGITSNFPIHLFDSLLPRWPTVAINLRDLHETDDAEQRVTLAESNLGGLAEDWIRIAALKRPDEGRLSKFFSAILRTMQNWTDNSYLRVPGYRDRIAHVRLKADEGGMNLDMDEKKIDRLTGWGREAGAALATRFTRDDAVGAELSWPNHQWVRFRSSMALFQEAVEKMSGSWAETPGYQELPARGRREHPTSYPFQRSVVQKAAAFETMKRLEELVELWKAKKPGFRDDRVPRPQPELRVMNRL